MTILITGGNGLVGRNLVEALTGTSHLILHPTSYEMNLLDESSTRTFLENAKPDLVIHCAGTVGGIQANIREPVRFFLENLDMARNLIISMKDLGIPRLLNLGSSCMYPKDHSGALSEDMILSGTLEPTNEGYALAKISAERLCRYISAEHADLSYKTLIPCNLYGKWDHFELGRAHMVPSIIAKLKKAIDNGADEVEIWGSGETRREFMYAGDLANFIVEAIERFDEIPGVLNVGLGSDFSVNEYYKIAASVVGYRGSFTHDLEKPEGMNRKLVDVTLLRAFGWRATTSLEEGLRLTYEFYCTMGRAI